ncbi:NAD(P)H-quinone oxidoreductase [Sphingomicrobium astaxanthinifaciens]|uniref:NAD(P)H-quinone oxidoreductase n=1 Tax=Sphingomicrobium astaxanthinifaciens TaxID=1227949 RepID=UPI001FCC46A8|nr:NAD(P)H-quinone oxidoreductase [Sphingomicrobium astaxanthinifaciens]MCJ7420607.1 NAD(P)H-quinone oxidoreductase [Sphingomicrobium astaxanthinifaciens]
MASDLPETMRCVVSPEPGQLELVERPLPRPGRGELLVKVAAAGVNRPDLLQVKGVYPPPEGASDVLGLELAGEVVARGAGCETPVGTRVCGLVAGGAYADYCLLPEGTALPVPERLGLEEAAALPETLFTVWINLFERGFAAEGDLVLVHGGTSGIGTMAIRLCRLYGITIIVTCGSEEKVEAALDIGAHAAINYRTEDFVDRVKDITEGCGVDIVLDMVGGDYVPRNLACMAEEGRHVSIAFQRGAEASLPIVQVMRRRLTLTGSTLRARSLRFKTMVADELRGTAWPFVEGGRLRPVMDRNFALAEVGAAHARMAAGQHVGKITLTP